jgi:Flp pilus assembly protein TadB
MGQAMIAIAVIAIAGTTLLALTAPRFIDPMFLEPPVGSYVLTALGVVGLIVGLIWMVRIYRGAPEPDQHAWRYRAMR